MPAPALGVARARVRELFAEEAADLLAVGFVFGCESEVHFLSKLLSLNPWPVDAILVRCPEYRRTKVLGSSRVRRSVSLAHCLRSDRARHSGGSDGRLRPLVRTGCLGEGF